MKTNNIFRMLLVAAALLLGANNVKAVVAGQIWPDDGDSNSNNDIEISNNKFTNRLTNTSIIRVYCTDVSIYSWQITFSSGDQTPDFYDWNGGTDWGATWYYTKNNHSSYLISDNGKLYFDLKCDNNTVTRLTSTGLKITFQNLIVSNVAIIEADSRTPVTLSFSNTWKDITVGDNGVDGLELITNPSGLSVTYGSSDDNFATVGTDGKVTGVAPGIATITATFEGNTTYKPNSKSYYLVVKHAFSGTAEGDQLWSGSVYFGDWQTTYGSQATIDNTIASSIQQGDKLRFYGAVETLPNRFDASWQLQLYNNLYNDNNAIALKESYNSADDTSLRENGYVEIEVTQDIYNKIQGGFNIQGYNLTLFRVTRVEVVTKDDVTLSFGETIAAATVGTNFTKTATATSNGENVTVAISYSSSNQTVATVNSSTGEVTPLTEGTTTITASFGGDNNYNPASSVSYTLTVNAAPQTPQYITVNMGSYECRTYVTTTNIDFSQSVGIKGYYASGLNSEGTAVQFTRVTGVVPASVPLLLQKISGAFEYKLRITDTAGTRPDPNYLVAGKGSASSLGNWVSGYNNYVLTVHDGQLVFAETSNNSAQVTGEHAYLHISPSNANARGHLIMSFDDSEEGTTGIDAIETNEQEVIYDLRGQRVQNLKKGVYIVNGKKMIIK
ncbi:MAG: Ig-like domain-containing protein [Prevotella sp.]|nr:Ig-like domain-containing protein [Prevotella sp.]